MKHGQIFISYSRENKAFAAKLFDHLQWEGYPVWMDPKIKPAELWRPQLEDNLKKIPQVHCFDFFSFSYVEMGTA